MTQTVNDNLTRSDLEAIDDIIEHKEFVRQNCIKLAKWQLAQGNLDIAKKLLVEAYTHDCDKFSGIQFLYMRKNAALSEKLALAVAEHNQTNLHHPEAWQNIHAMTDLYLMVMTCDIAARSAQFCTDLRQWIRDTAMSKYRFTEKDEVYQKMQTYLDVIVDQPFRPVKPILKKTTRRKAVAVHAD